MKCTIPEISWHNREPVLSVDLHPVESDFYRLATGGSDTFILIWQLKITENGGVNVDILSELTRHQKAVNVVRWSPNGQYLASGDDDANIILWQLKTDNIPLLEGENNFKETWIAHKVLRGHKEDIYDLCWSPNGDHLLSGSVDNTAILWDIVKGRNENIISDHKSFVQGVAWDPENQYLATLSSDRICRVIDSKSRRVKSRIYRGTLPVPESHPMHDKEVKYFHDDTFKTFFRRLTFTPDGSFLVVPSGCVESEDGKDSLYATYLFTLDSLNKPIGMLPMPKQCSIAVKCCPILFELRPSPKPIVDLPYRIVIAVATDSDVILYDTQQLAPFAHLQNIHYTRLTDLTWSHDGQLLIASSTDGFITLVTFEVDEIGVKYVKEEVENMDCTLNISDKIEETEKVEDKEVKLKRPSFLEQWAKQGPKRMAEDVEDNLPKKVKVSEVIEIEESPIKEDKEKINVIVPKRKITETNIQKVNKQSPKKIKPVDSAKEDEIKIIEVDDKNEKGSQTNEKIEDENIKSVAKKIKINNNSKKKVAIVKTKSPKIIKPVTLKEDSELTKINNEETKKINVLTPKRKPSSRIEENAVKKDKEQEKNNATEKLDVEEDSENVKNGVKIINKSQKPKQALSEVTTISESPEKSSAEETKRPVPKLKRITPITIETKSPKRRAMLTPVKANNEEGRKKLTESEENGNKNSIQTEKSCDINKEMLLVDEVGENSEENKELLSKENEDNVQNNEKDKNNACHDNDVEILETPNENTEMSKKTRSSIKKGKNQSDKNDSMNSNKKASGRKQQTPKNDNTGQKTKSEEKSKSSTKRKPKDNLPNSGPKVSLLQFFKPISTEQIKEEKSDSDADIKINPKALFKKTKITDEVIDLCDDTGDAPEDFKLQVEESMPGDECIIEEKEVIEKENETESKSVKQPRRIPLITLSSPKIKKKKNND